MRRQEYRVAGRRGRRSNLRRRAACEGPHAPQGLKGFARIDLQPGETKSSTVTLDRRAFSYYDVPAQKWNISSSDFDILVGRSSQNIQLHGSVSLVAKAQ
ncbi:MAG: fibronectin type III-like domain-contianing protein [Candidatus Acidiferrales bacterium]